MKSTEPGGCLKNDSMECQNQDICKWSYGNKKQIYWQSYRRCPIWTYDARSEQKKLNIKAKKKNEKHGWTGWYIDGLNAPQSDRSSRRPVNLSICVPINISNYRQSVWPSTCQPVDPSTCLPVDLLTNRPVNRRPVYLWTI